MTTPSRPKRRASMAKGGPVMLSWFSATKNIEPEEAKAAKAATKPSQETATKSHMLPYSPHQQQRQQQRLEVQITGLELLRRNESSYNNRSRGESMQEDSFSFDSYAHDSFPLVATNSANHYHATVLRSGLVHRAPKRQMSNCSSLGFEMGNSSVSRTNKVAISSNHCGRRFSLESATTFGSQSSCLHKNNRSPRRRQSTTSYDSDSFVCSSFAKDSFEGLSKHNVGRTLRNNKISYSKNKTTLKNHRRTMPRRGSTGTHDLPGFGAYKRRRSSLGPATLNHNDPSNHKEKGVNQPPPLSLRTARRSHSLGTGTTNTTTMAATLLLQNVACNAQRTDKPMESLGGGGRRWSLGSRRRNSLGSQRTSLASRRSSLGSEMDANSIGSWRLGSSCNSAGGRARV